MYEQLENEDILQFVSISFAGIHIHSPVIPDDYNLAWMTEVTPKLSFGQMRFSWNIKIFYLILQCTFYLCLGTS